jgi:hypothetical protein
MKSLIDRYNLLWARGRYPRSAMACYVTNIVADYKSSERKAAIIYAGVPSLVYN